MENNNKPVLSIITVVFNGEKYIEQTINSVITQNIPDLEYIIIDGGSSDGTLNIINKYSDFITHFISEKDNGIYDAINKGINLATGDYIGIINSDDWYEPNIMQEIVNVILNNKADIIYGILRLWENSKLIGVQGFTREFLPNGMISHPTCFVKKEIYKNIGNFNIQYKIAADYDFMLKCYNENQVNFYYLEKIIANFRLSGVSIVNAKLRRSETNKILLKNKIINRRKYYFELLKSMLRF